MSFTQRLKADFTPLTLALIPVAIALNIVFGQISSTLSLPVFLDSLGTMLAALLAGPLVGGLVGLLTNLVWGLIADPVAAAFAPVAMTIGIVTGLLAQVGMFRRWWQAILSGVIIAVVISFVAVPIRIYLFGGVTGSGADFITAYLLAVGQGLFSSVLITVISSNLLDKTVTAFVAWALVRTLSNRFINLFPRAVAVVGE